VTSLLPKPNLAPHLGANHLGAYKVEVLLEFSYRGVANGRLGEEYRPSGYSERIEVLPSVSIAAILPLSGLDQRIFLYAY